LRSTTPKILRHSRLGWHGEDHFVDGSMCPSCASVRGVTSPRPIRIAVQIQPQHADYADVRRAVTAAEEAGVDIVMNWDHFFPISGPRDGKHFECWTMLGAWAEATSRVEIGALVTCNSYRNPDLLADMARTVDHISDGRLILGIGSGWAERDYREYGYEFGTAGSRLDDLADALPRIERRWSRLDPPPTRRIPVLIGGSGERKTMRLVAKHADIWHSFSDASDLPRKSKVLEDWCAQVGRNPAEIERSVNVRRSPVEVADALLDAGATLFVVSLRGPAFDLGPTREWVAWRDDGQRS
jgi:probable F420-dependent oxidoreductase